MLKADVRDYKTGYFKHYDAYRKLEQQDAVIRSRRMLLVYCVECGLKCLLLKKWCIYSVEDVNNDSEQRNILVSHDLQKMLKALGQAGTFTFPSVKTSHNDDVSVKNFHELCRYNIKVDKHQQDNESQYEVELQRIAEWIGVDIG